MADDYITTEELKYTSEMSGFSFADGDIINSIATASRAIDEHCGRRFWKDADPQQVRYYNPTSWEYVRIDDLITLTSLQTDDDGGSDYANTWTEGTDFLLEPLNAPADGQPFTQIRRHPSSSFTLPTGYPRTVKVTGQFGWQEVPQQVKTATSILAVRLLKRMREAPFGIAGVGIDGVSVRIAPVDPDVRSLIQPYVRGTLAI